MLTAATHSMGESRAGRHCREFHDVKKSMGLLG
jgi:hypothetical protein